MRAFCKTEMSLRRMTRGIFGRARMSSGGLSMRAFRRRKYPRLHYALVWRGESTKSRRLWRNKMAARPKSLSEAGTIRDERSELFSLGLMKPALNSAGKFIRDGKFH